MDGLSIKVDHLTKTFKLPKEKRSSIKSIVVNPFVGNKGYELQRALDDISFEIKKGEFFGIIGRNGSGKSTLLKLLAGIYSPTSGQIAMDGSLTPFIELGVGFNQELTGRENIFLNGALLGFNRKEMQAMYGDIVEFAELEKFMDQKLKNYSSGMQVRLAFSIAIRSQSDILLIDEVLAVGDMAFQEKCYKYFEEVKKTGKTVIFVSHDGGAVERFCHRVAIIDKAKLIAVGEPADMVLRYGAIIAQEQIGRAARASRQKEQKIKGLLEITDVIVLAKTGKASASINFGDSFSVRVGYKLREQIKEPVMLGIDIIDSERNTSLLGPNSREENRFFELKKSGHFEAKFPINPLAPKTYNVTAAVFNQQETFAYDLVENAVQFKILGKPRHGGIYIKPEWSVRQGGNKAAKV